MKRALSFTRSSLVALVASALVFAGAATASAVTNSTFTNVYTPAIGNLAPAVGDVLSVAIPGPPDPSPESLDVAWIVGNTAVSTMTIVLDDDAVTPNYAVSAADLGEPISVRLTWKAVGYDDAIVQSAPTAPVVKGTQSFTPAISGSALYGHTLSVKGLPSGATYKYVWKRGGSSSAVSTKSTYKLSSNDLGHTVTVTVTGTKSGFTTLTKTSAKTAIVVKTFTWHHPTISGTAKTGQKLTAKTSAWSPTPTFKYQWYRDGVAISGSTHSYRTLTSYDEGAKLTVKITGYKSGYLTTSATSAATAVVGKGAITVASPSISGTRQAGHTLTAVAHTPSPSSAAKTYQWYRSGVKVEGATHSTYALKNVDAGKTITVHVVYTKAGYTTKTAYSSSTSTIAKRSVGIKSGVIYSPKGISGYTKLSAGTYYSNTTGTTCQWERDSGTTAKNAEVITGAQGLQHNLVRIESTDSFFYTTGCGTWYRYDGTGSPRSTIGGDGIYAVGVDFVPGSYQVNGPVDGCILYFLSNASNEDSSILESYNPGLGDVYPIFDTDAYIATAGCGEWARIGD